VKGGLVDREVSIETSLKRSIRHQQSCQLTENALAAVEAHWRANLHHQECLAVVLNLGEDVASTNYDSLKRKSAELIMNNQGCTLIQVQAKRTQ
jgi:hypothetical protein